MTALVFDIGRIGALTHRRGPHALSPVLSCANDTLRACTEGAAMAARGPGCVKKRALREKRALRDLSKIASARPTRRDLNVAEGRRIRGAGRAPPLSPVYWFEFTAKMRRPTANPPAIPVHPNSLDEKSGGAAFCWSEPERRAIRQLAWFWIGAPP